jgi:regulator of sirC expression with transglutaminase-like and TPR domain
VDRAALHEFGLAIAGRDNEVDLFGAAMIIAGLRGEPVDPHDCARQLDLIAEAAADHAGSTLAPEALANAIDFELFTVRGFHGNASNYAEPENSYLDRVLERRTGLPIALSLVYMEVAQRIGLRCDGVGYPGHFIVRCGEPDAPIYVDPFNQGVRLDREELIARLRGQQLNGASPDSFLAAISRRQFIQRMLRNLHVAFREQRDLDRWLAVVELSLVLEPWNAALVGERGMLHYRLGHPAEALEDLQRYVDSAAPDTVSAGALRLLDELRLRLGGREEVQ